VIRIARLDLLRWGHFDDRRIELGPTGALHVVYGGNEAGKSTTRRAIGALLFGVPERTTDRFGRPGGELRIGARLELDGVPVELIRRKGRKDTLLAADGRTVLDPAPLERALGSLTGEVHAGLMEITHASLVEGGEDLLEGRGAVGESLFAAAAGTTRLHRLMRELEEEADGLFTPRGRKKTLNSALAAHQTAARALRDAAVRAPEFDQRRREVSELDDAHRHAGEALADIEREIARLERLRGALPLVARRAAALAEAAELADASVLGADAPERRGAAERARETALARAGTAERALARRREQLAGLVVDEPLVAAAPLVADVAARRTALRQDAAARDDLAAEIAADRARLTALLEGLRGALGGRSLEAVELDDVARERLEACLAARAGIDRAVQDAARALEDAARRAEADAVVDDTRAVADEGPLTAAIRAARGAGAPEEAADAARARERAARARADVITARLHPAATDAAALARLPVPAAPIVEALLTEHGRLDAEHADLDADRDRHVAALAELQAERAAVGGELTSLLDDDALAVARHERDARWTAIRDAIDAGELPDPRALDDFEDELREADDLADHRVRHANEMGLLASIDAAIERQVREGEALAARDAALTEAVAALAAAWSQAWAPVGELVPAPEAAAAWLGDRREVLMLLDDAAGAAEEAERAEALAARHAAALREALEATGVTPAPGAHVTLAALLEQASEQVDALREAREGAVRAAEAARRSADDLATARTRHERALAEAADWRSQWETLRDGCGLDPDLSADDALGALRRLADAVVLQRSIDERERRVAALAGRVAAFSTDVAAIVADVAPELAGREAAATAAVLAERLETARAVAHDRAAAEQEITERENERAEARAEAGEAEEHLAALRKAAGASDDAGLVRAEERSARAAALRVELARLAGEIAQAGGTDVDTVAAEVAELDADAVPAQLDELATGAARRRAERDEAFERLTRARDELARLEGSEEAPRAAQAAAGQLAEVRALAERYARARLAQRVLRDAIERYRADHEGPMLRRANELFPALTRERFSALITEFDEDDKSVLVAVTAAGERRRVEQLSDGTREQLFLALRLAAIERYVEASGAVPVVFDDVLLESDDPRARRILAALAELAARTQVLVFTHHRHLVALAREAVPSDRLDVVALDPSPEDGDPLAAGESAPTLAEELDRITPGEQGALL